jgi:hypothetical protein
MEPEVPHEPSLSGAIRSANPAAGTLLATRLHRLNLKPIFGFILRHRELMLDVAPRCSGRATRRAVSR